MDCYGTRADDMPFQQQRGDRTSPGITNDNGNGDSTEEAGKFKSTHSEGNARNGMKWTGGICDTEEGSSEEKHARPVSQAEDGRCAHEPREKEEFGHSLSQKFPETP